MKTDNSCNAVETPAGLEARLEALIDRLAGEEKRAAASTRGKRWWASGAAASVAILLAAGIYLGHPGNTGSPPPLSREQELACLQAREALALVARNLNKGVEQLALVTNEIEKSSRIINKTLKR